MGGARAWLNWCWFITSWRSRSSEGTRGDAAHPHGAATCGHRGVGHAGLLLLLLCGRGGRRGQHLLCVLLDLLHVVVVHGLAALARRGRGGQVGGGGDALQEFLERGLRVGAAHARLPQAPDAAHQVIHAEGALHRPPHGVPAPPWVAGARHAAAPARDPLTPRPPRSPCALPATPTAAGAAAAARVARAHAHTRGAGALPRPCWLTAGVAAGRGGYEARGPTRPSQRGPRWRNVPAGRGRAGRSPLRGGAGQGAGRGARGGAHITRGHSAVRNRALFRHRYRHRSRPPAAAALSAGGNSAPSRGGAGGGHRGVEAPGRDRDRAAGPRLLRSQLGLDRGG